MNYISKFIKEVKQKKLDDEWIPRPGNLATNEDIEYSEHMLGIRFPESYKTLVSKYSNGDIYMLGAEPLSGVGKINKDSLAKIDFTYKYLGFNHCPDEKVLIKPLNKSVKLDKLISFTFGDAGNAGNDHWVFICDKEYPNNDYPVGYISNYTKNIVFTLENFEEWLKVLWEYNKDEEPYCTPVFYTFFETQDERDELLES